MLEKIEHPPSEPSADSSLDQWPYFQGTPTSKDFLAAKKFAQKYIAEGKYDGPLFDDAESIDRLKTYIESLGRKLGPSTSAEDVIAELRKGRVFAEPVREKKVKQEKPVEFLKTEYVTLETPIEVSLAEDQAHIVEGNLLWEELQKQGVFKNDEELEALHRQCMESRTGRIESESYYYEFSTAGLIKGGTEEVRADLEALAQRKKDFEQGGSTRHKKEQERLERAKKIATMTEQSLVHAITTRSWYGEDISIEPVSEFDDVKRGVDDMLEIRKDDEESSFLGLGIDVTFRGLKSEEFEKKFFGLLSSIYDGYKTKVKYFKNHRGELLKEFAVPKMVLYLGVNDVNDMVSILRDEEGVAAREQKQKENILQQVMQSCAILAEFAETCENNIFRRYGAVRNSIKELAWKNKDVKKILDEEAPDEVSRHMRELIDKFKLIKEQERQQAA